MRYIMAGLVTAVLLGGCLGGEGGTEASTETTSADGSATGEARPVADVPELSEPPLGAGATAEVGSWGLRVVSVVTDAGEMVLAANRFNEPPGEGVRFVVATLEVTNHGDAASGFLSDVRLTSVGPSRVAYDSRTAHCGVIPDDLGALGDLDAGVAASGNVCWAVAEVDAGGLVMIATPVGGDPASGSAGFILQPGA